MPSSHFIRTAIAALALGAPSAAAAQLVPAPPAPLQEANATKFTIFLRGTPLGSEQVSLARIADGWMISSTGRLAPPVDVVARRLQVRYTADWRPLEFTFDGTLRGQSQVIHTIVDGTTAKSDVTAAGQTTPKEDPIDPNTGLVLTNSFFGPYEAVAARLKSAAAGTEIPAYGEGPMLPFRIRVGESVAEQIQTAPRMAAARRRHPSRLLPGRV